MGLAKEVRDQKFKEGQEIAELVTRAEMKLGKILAELPKSSGVRTDLTSGVATPEVVKPKSAVIAEAGIAPTTAKEFQRMAANPAAVEAAIAEAKENGDIVSRRAVIGKIKAEQKTCQNLSFYPGMPDGKVKRGKG